jgi:uncharacterized membrane protein YdjX (TVP38/TMEM64 family)
MTARTILPRALLALAIVGAATWLALERDRLDPASIEGAVRDLGLWAPVAHVALFALGTVLFVPGAIFGLAGGVLFGPLWGTLLNLAGATLGATAAFLVARYLAADWVARKAGGRLQRLIAGVEAEGWRFVAFVRLVPLFPFNLLNYALGLTRVRFADYLLASIGMLPGTLLYVYYGKLAGDVAALAGGAPVPRDAGYWSVLLLGLAATVLVTAVVTRTARRALAEATGEAA